MNVKVITRHTPSNYGSLLQALATQEVIRAMGHNVEIIDYRRPDERGLSSVVTSLKGKPQYSRNPLKAMAYVACMYPETKIAEIKFDKMRRKYLNLTKVCTSSAELSSLKSDIFLTGSDQVWGPMINGRYDEAYFLEFVHQGKKAAYAASFGRTNFTDDTMRRYTEMLRGYDAVAVREDSAVKLLETMGVPCEGQVLDPTLLLNSEQWCKYIDKDIQDEYVLVYQLHNNPALSNYASDMARHLHLPLIRISPSFHQFRRGGKFVYLPDTGEFLSYIKNSTFFVTDSFHGTAFALNFQRQFAEILPNNSTGSRNQSILQLTGLSDRIVTDYNDFSIAEKEIDYKKVEDNLAKEREKSLLTLKNIIEKKIYYRHENTARQ